MIINLPRLNDKAVSGHFNQTWVTQSKFITSLFPTFERVASEQLQNIIIIFLYQTYFSQWIILWQFSILWFLCFLWFLLACPASECAINEAKAEGTSWLVSIWFVQSSLSYDLVIDYFNKTFKFSAGADQEQGPYIVSSTTNGNSSINQFNYRQPTVHHNFSESIPYANSSYPSRITPHTQRSAPNLPHNLQVSEDHHHLTFSKSTHQFENNRF